MQIHELGTRTPGVYDYAALDTGSQTYKAQVGNLKPEYTSYDSANPTSWAEVATMGSNTPISTFFERVTYIARNVRYLWKLIGSGSFSNVASTIAGAIGNTALTTTATSLSGAIAEHEVDISDINADISTINGNLANKQNKVKFLSFTGTPTSAGNISHTFNGNVWVLAAISSQLDTVVIPYPGGGGNVGGRAGWWFNIHTTSVAFPPYTGSQTIYVAYVEM